MRYLPTMGALLTTILITSCATPGVNLTGSKPLYDEGSNLLGWTKVGESNWRIQEGAIQADLMSGKLPGYLVSKKTYTDYQIYAEFWVDSETNSGIFIRCENPEKIGADNCYEVNIWDTRPDPTYGTGAIVDSFKVSEPYPKVGGRWSVMEITAKGQQFTVKINGQVTVSGTDNKHSKGHIALQHGGGTVKFRKVLIKEL
jgi:Domain of Unknown Function (DUF1080)